MTTHSSRVPRQKWLRWLPALWTAIMLAACGQSPLATTGRVVIAWHSLSGAKERALLNLIDEFNSTNADHITVVPEERAPNALHTDVLNGIERKALPTLILATPMQAAVYQRRGALVPMNDYMTSANNGSGWNANDRADLYPFIMKAGRTANGQIIGIPYGGIVRLMLYNRDWLKTLNMDTAPTNWDNFTSACNAATDRVKGTLCFGIQPTTVAFEQFLAAYGGQIATDDMNVLQISTPAAVQSMNTLAGFVRTSQAYRVNTLQQSRDDFATARVLFAFDWSNNLPDVDTTVKQRAAFDWGVGLLPSVTPQASTKYTAPLWVITRVADQPQPEREKAAWSFIHWLTQPTQTAAWAQQTHELPARLSAINILSAKQPLSQNEITLLRDIAPRARPDPLISGLGCVENTLTSGIRQILDGQPVTQTLQLTQAIGQPQLGQDCTAP